MTTKHRPPHGSVKIEELIKLNRHDEAQKCCDENVDFYHAKIAEQQDIFVLAQCHKMGLKPNRDTLFAVASNTPQRRHPPGRIEETAKRLGLA